MRIKKLSLSGIERTKLFLGYVGENEHTQVRFDASCIYTDNPGARAGLTMQNPAGTVFPIVLDADGNEIIWNVSASDVAIAGNGSYQLTFTDNDEIIKTFIGQLFVLKSLTSAGDIPTPIENWIDQANQKLSEVEAATESIDNMDASATKLSPDASPTVTVSDVDGHKHLAFGIPQGEKGDKGEKGDTYEVTPENIEEISSRVVQSATIAQYTEGMADQVEAAQQHARDAGDSATAADSSKKAAAQSAQAASQSATAADTSARNAAQSETNAGNSAQAASQSAQAASQSATNAATSERNAANSARDAHDVLDSIPEDYSTLSNDVTVLKSALNSRLNFLAFEQGSYNTGSGNPLDNNTVIRSISKIEYPMHIDTGSDDYLISNIYTYNAADDSFLSYSAVGARSADVNPVGGTYVKITLRRSDSATIVPTDIHPDGFVAEMTASAQDTDSNSIALTVTEDYTYRFVKGAYISNAQSVGQTVDLSPIANASYAYVIVPCRAGDVFILTGTGGGTQRLYGFVTEKLKKAKGAAQNASVSGEALTVPVNGYFIANVQIALAYSLLVKHRGSMADVNGIVHFIGETTIDYSPAYIKGKTIVDNGSVGDTVNITPTTNDAYGYAIVKCVKGDKFVLTGKGGSTALIWCFVDRDYKILSRASVITVSNLELIAQQDGYLISNVQQGQAFSLIKTGCADPSVLQSIYNETPSRFIMPTSIYGKSGVSMYAYTPEIFSNWKHLNNYQLTLSGLTDAQSIEDSVAPRMILPLATKTMKMSLQNYRNNEVVNKSVLVKTVSTLSNTSATVLVIGDSFIRYKWGDGILKYMSDFAADDGVSLTFIGTVTTGYGYQAEGRGGWSALDYLTHYVPIAERDPSATDEQKKMPSPFVFSNNDTVADAYFDFAKYLTVNNLTTPDIIIISLGMNAGNTSADAINTMIADIHGDYPNIPIIVSMIPTVPRRINTGDFYTRKTTRENQNLSYIAKFDGRESEKIYISPEHLALDGILGLTGSEQNVNPVSLESGDEIMEIVNTGIHPTAVGAWNIAKWKYESLVYVMQQS